MKIFITGGSGLLGQYLNLELSKRNQILTQYNNNIGNCADYENIKVDLSNYEALRKIFDDFNPDIVIHTAAISNPSSAQNMDPKKVYEINVTATTRIAELCDIYNAKMVYTSTDLVYSGYRGSMLKEDSKLIPVSLYAETKLMGEIKIRETFDNFIILRTALLYGLGLHHTACYFDKMYNYLKLGKEVKLFTDQFRTPVSLSDSARMISEVLSRNIRNEILNFGGLERVSRYELGERLCEFCGFDKKLLVQITMDDIPLLPKVEDVSMNTDKLQSYGIKPKSITESLKEILTNK